MTFSSESDEPELRLKVEHPRPQNKERQPIKKHACSIEDCLAIFSRPWRLAAHMAASHNGERPFTCQFPGCNKKYTSSSHLRRHKLNSHPTEGEKKQTFKCSYPDCTAVLKTKEIQKKHFRRKHSPKPFKCSSCSSLFSKRSQLKSHMFVHTGIPPYSCGLCEQKFRTRMELTRHNRGHRVHICPMRGCAESFKSWSLVRKHIAQVHKQPFICDYCGALFKIRHGIRKHMKVHITKGKKYVHNPVYKVNCPTCLRPFTCKGSLKRHIAIIHENIRPQKPPKEKKERARRKDASIPRKSMACTLSLLQLPVEIQKDLVRKENPEKIDILDLLMLENQSENLATSECEDLRNEENVVLNLTDGKI